MTRVEVESMHTIYICYSIYRRRKHNNKNNDEVIIENSTTCWTHDLHTCCSKGAKSDTVIGSNSVRRPAKIDLWPYGKNNKFAPCACNSEATDVLTAPPTGVCTRRLRLMSRDRVSATILPTYHKPRSEEIASASISLCSGLPNGCPCLRVNNLNARQPHKLFAHENWLQPTHFLVKSTETSRFVPLCVV